MHGHRLASSWSRPEVQGTCRSLCSGWGVHFESKLALPWLPRGLDRQKRVHGRSCRPRHIALGHRTGLLTASSRVGSQERRAETCQEPLDRGTIFLSPWYLSARRIFPILQRNLVALLHQDPPSLQLALNIFHTETRQGPCLRGLFQGRPCSGR
jgi:hypothetical protein